MKYFLLLFLSFFIITPCFSFSEQLEVSYTPSFTNNVNDVFVFNVTQSFKSSSTQTNISSFTFHFYGTAGRSNANITINVYSGLNNTGLLKSETFNKNISVWPSHSDINFQFTNSLTINPNTVYYVRIISDVNNVYIRKHISSTYSDGKLYINNNPPDFNDLYFLVYSALPEIPDIPMATSLLTNFKNDISSILTTSIPFSILLIVCLFFLSLLIPFFVNFISSRR